MFCGMFSAYETDHTQIRLQHNMLSKIVYPPIFATLANLSRIHNIQNTYHPSFFLTGVVFDFQDNFRTMSHNTNFLGQRTENGYSSQFSEEKSMMARLVQEKQKTNLAQHAATALSNQVLQAVLNTLPDAIFVVDLQGKIVSCNQNCKDLWQFADEWITDYVPLKRLATMAKQVQDPPSFVSDMREIEEQGEKVGSGSFAMKDGRTIEWHATPYHLGQKYAGRVWSFRDVSHQQPDQQKPAFDVQKNKEYEQLLKRVAEMEQRNRESTLINEMNDLLQNCESFEEFYEVIGQTADLLFNGQAGMLYVLNSSRNLLEAVTTWGDLPPTSLTLVPDSCHECLEQNRGWARIVNGPRARTTCSNHTETAKRLFPYICIPLVGPNTVLGVLHLDHSPQGPDVHDERWERLGETVARSIALAMTNLYLREQLRSQSIRDSLTNLYNKDYLKESLDREFQRYHRHKQPVGVVMLDIDHFNAFNEMYGHEGGNAFLRAIAAFLQMSIRGEDIACRYDGEEFVIVLTGASLGDTWRRAEDIRDGVMKMDVRHDGQPLGCVTVSIGIATFPKHGDTAKLVLESAQGALQRAKEEGRNRVIVADINQSVLQK